MVLYLSYFDFTPPTGFSVTLVLLHRKDLFASPCTHTPVPLTVSYSDLFCQQVYPLRRWSRLGSSQMGHKEYNILISTILHIVYIQIVSRHSLCSIKEGLPLLIMLAYRIVTIPQHFSLWHDIRHFNPLC